MLPDLMVPLDSLTFIQSSPGVLYLKLPPKNSTILKLDLDVATRRQHKSYLNLDKKLHERFLSHQYIAKVPCIRRVSSKRSIQEVVFLILVGMNEL